MKFLCTYSPCPTKAYTCTPVHNCNKTIDNLLSLMVVCKNADTCCKVLMRDSDFPYYCIHMKMYVKCTVDICIYLALNKKIVNFKTSFKQSQALYVSGNIKKNHCRRTVRVPTLNFAEVIDYDELSMRLRNKRNKKFCF